MALSAVFLVTLLVGLGAGADDAENEYFAYEWQEKWYEGLPIDHFGLADNRTFNLRYLYNTTYAAGQTNPPIFLYCGNEMRIESFANNSGFMWDLAPEFNAVLLFIEHRYYGKSLPFGNETFTDTANYGYLNANQALADFAQVVINLKATNPQLAKSPVIAMGGSYGAMLAMFMRIKYPHVVVGGYCSSGPVWQFLGESPCWNYAAKTTETFSKSGKNCDKLIKASWAAIRRLANTDEGRSFINAEFNVCPDEQLVGEGSEVDGLIGVVAGAFGNLAMLDYPYETNFVKPLPAWPARVSCDCFSGVDIEDDEALAKGVHCASMVFYNSSGQFPCLTMQEVDDTFGAWPIQTCSDQMLPNCQNGTDMFEPAPFNLQEYSDTCQQQWGLRPRPFWNKIEYGGKKLQWLTNMIFTNGDLDPWSLGGITEAYPGMDRSVHVINIRNAAHHLELRSERPDDALNVRLARNAIRRIIGKWVQYKY